ncbi:MAG TPA: RNA polymerase sigma factor [Patescibacteria group bacterium]|jgi:RNA polymerase sigma-70 factor (ECF subfamily)|nr:RNA polymerase sigma factor [Patescibacteria group bacterium]
MKTEADDLVKRIGRGEQIAAVDLIDLFYERIYAFLRRLCFNDADAADLTQKTFAKVWQALPGFNGRSSVGSWIHSIAYHTYVDWRRSSSATEARSSEWWADRICSDPLPDEIACRNELSVKTYTAVDQLAEELRNTIHLHYYQELTIQETADAMGVATSTVKYRVRQALRELQQKVGTTGSTKHLSSQII